MGKSSCSRSLLLTLLIYTLFVFLLNPLAYGQDDEMETAMKSIWPDKDVKVRKEIDDTLGVTITNYGVNVLEGGYDYVVVVAIMPDNPPADLLQLLTDQPVESKEYEVKGIDPPVWITRAQLATYFNEDMTTRNNKYIVQNTDFRCGNKYITVAIHKDSGSSQFDQSFNDPNSSKVVNWTNKLLPLSKELAQKTASAVCGGGCNTSEIYKFYKKFFNVQQSSLAFLGVQFDEKFNKNYKEGYERAYTTYPLTCPRQTKQAMLNLINGGFDAPEIMWRITAKKAGYQEEKGTPPEYGNFYKNLAASLGNKDPLVRRFVHYPRKMELRISVGKKMDKPLKDILLHIISGQVSKISGKITEHSIDAASWVLLDENNARLFDADKFKYYVDLFDFTNSSLSSDAKGHEVVIDYIGLYGKNSGKKKVEKGVGLIKEAMFFLPELIKLYDIQMEYNFVNRTFDELQADFPDTRRAYEESLLRLNLIRYGMRDSLAEWKMLQERNKQYDSIHSWPESDREIAYKLVGTISRNQSMFAKLNEAHGILLEELRVKKDEFVLTWYLLGYAKGTVPPMEVIY